MSASHKPTLGLSPLSGAIYLGRQSKAKPGEWVGEKTDVTGLFTGIMLAKFGPEAPETVRQVEFTGKGLPTYRLTIERIDP